MLLALPLGACELIEQSPVPDPLAPPPETPVTTTTSALGGDNLSSVRLEQGDVVFVPVHAAQVSIRGEVTRPGIYELTPGETVADLLRYAGGLASPASLRRLRINRLVTDGSLGGGVDRISEDFNLAEDWIRIEEFTVNDISFFKDDAGNLAMKFDSGGELHFNNIDYAPGYLYSDFNIYEYFEPNA